MAHIGVVSFALGAYLRRRAERGPSKGVIDRRHLTPLRITYSLLFAYPFRATYTSLALSLGP
ncbi:MULTISPECIES: hypothetical protein [unclassified Corallococcus]|uniref:hypothetical protein n=1 Tax=unclassified Corallococcus TaxID=2685029 RepID=UPI001A8C9A60|nr:MULTISPECIES: hypothetical protein [unclassified Corallococcus]MBN9682112.1 hypothetical protein [Corallococcus sp. NCSPR001]WAS86327.1 hypothetical protein O0N60_04980 [Corallococcus sp. NCRR]